MNIITHREDTLNDLELECKILIARTELAMYDKSFPIALDYILQAKQVSKEFGYTELLLTSLEKLNLIYQATGNTHKQIEVLDELNDIQDKRYKNYVTIKISELQKLFEQESQEREIDQLKNRWHNKSNK